jgi:hypothetical protein
MIALASSRILELGATVMEELPTTEDLDVHRAGRPELPLREMACLHQLATRALCPNFHMQSKVE